MQRPLRELGKAAPYVLGALKLMLTAPFSIENVPKAIRGDYVNVSLMVDLTLSAIDNLFTDNSETMVQLLGSHRVWERFPTTGMLA